MERAFKTIAPFIGTFAAGVIGMVFVGPEVGTWYQTLTTPPLTPPDQVFPVVWTILYLLMALACAIVWRKEPQTDHTEGWVRFFFVQLFLNMGWVIFFFGYHSITIAFFDALVLLFIVFALTVSAWEIDHRTTYLMAPYVLWILFACYLTAGVWMLN